MRNFLKGVLCSLALAGCMPNYKSTESLEGKLMANEDSSGLKSWQYPVNIVGGFFVHIFTHESGHAAIALAQGADIEEFHPYPGFVYNEFHGGWVLYSSEDLSSREKGLIYITGPLANVALAEIINYNLREGNISPEYQSFWATSSLMARCAPIYISIKSFSDELNDFKSFEENTDISKETMAGLVALYTAFSYKRIAKEFKVATGQEFYEYNPNKTGLYLFPLGNGFALTYSIGF